MGRLDLPGPASSPRPRSSPWAKALLAALLILVATFRFGPAVRPTATAQNSLEDYALKDVIPEPVYDAEWLKEHSRCPIQPKPLHPKIKWVLTEEERAESLRKYSEAIQIPTQSYDDNGEPNEDPRWKPFFDFQDWLRKAFPLAHEKGEVEHVNTLGILATFKGSDPSLKPILLMSHYDVVPAPDSTLDRWTHPPFSGHNDGKHIWGRGSADDKSLLVAQWEAVTHLLEDGFEPKRTIILSHGFDEEEVFARRGQGHIAPLLEERYGKDGLLLVIDEGSGWTDDFYGEPFALPAMGEKGYLDIEITVGTPGGHSSVPPAHTAIGIASQIVNVLESHPFPVKLTPSSPILTSLLCANEHAHLPKEWSRLLRKEGPTSYPRLSHLFAQKSNLNKAEVGTTTAVDIIKGGVKVNALPEVVTIQVNFRIDFSESVSSTQYHVTRLLRHVAKKADLSLSAFEGSNTTQLGNRYVKVETLGLPLEPAPLTPSSGGVWDLFAGTVKAVFPGPDGKERIVSPSASTGNTDCKMYYNLTKNVYRFMGSRPASSNAHTVNEKALIEGHFDIISWIHAIVQNADAYEAE